jgi:hypothetical protein
MSSAYATKVAEGFSQKLLLEMYDRSLIDTIVNRDYEGEINGVGSKLNILNFARISEKTYVNAALSADSLYEVNATLTIDQYKSFYWKEKTLAKWLSYIKNPHPTVVSQKADERNKNMDTFVLGLYADVGAGNRVGTDYTTGTVTVADTTGVVTPAAGATFSAAMEGRGFKADGHTKWYRVKVGSYASQGNGNLVIEDDSDDEISAYTGGAIAGSSTYTIEAATVLSITTTNLLQYVSKLKEKLDIVERYGYSSVPDSDRWLIVPPEFESILVRASGVALHVPDVYTELIKKGMITQLQGFNVFKSNRLTGNNTDGWRILAGHSSWVTFAEKLLTAEMEEDLPGDFGSAYKDLFVYGAKVTDARRHFAAEGFWKFS